jgi:hypothetical protein
VNDNTLADGIIEGHARLYGLDELVRVTRAGGYIRARAPRAS